MISFYNDGTEHPMLAVFGKQTEGSEGAFWSDFNLNLIEKSGIVWRGRHASRSKFRKVFKKPREI